MAILNKKYYKGTDLYSDGEVEYRLLDYLRNLGDEKADIDEEDLFMFDYHLSPERENILNWYPFTKSDSILEVGAGCGALSGLLCRKAKSVTAVELSLLRSTINYERNCQYDNLEIVVGNLNEMQFDKQFDYIILNGVFEYAISFTHTDNPYVDFLTGLMGRLNPSGKVLLAIENRIGIKYLSGAPEDHTKCYYLGIQDYVGNNQVKTFSKSELIDIFCKCGIEKYKFYYPYPDYKFPIEIFTDENINTFSYEKLCINRQDGVVRLFDDAKMIRCFKNEKIMGNFANSFLAELCLDAEAKTSDVIYAKVNNLRKEEYRIGTIIHNSDGVYSAEKLALSDAGFEHMEKVYDNQNKCKLDNFCYIQGVKQNDRSIVYPYISDDNMDSVLFNKMISSANYDDLIDFADLLVADLSKQSVYKDDYCDSELFVRLFGDSMLSKKLPCVCEVNIDIILDNVFCVEKSKYMIIDSEWVVDCFVPMPFVVWRMLNEFFSRHTEVHTYIAWNEILNRYNISCEDDKIYRSWAEHFANQYVNEQSVLVLNRKIKPVDINGLIYQDINSYRLQTSLYYDLGEGFSEENKTSKDCYVDNDGLFEVSYKLDDVTICGLRWDPHERQFCECQIEKITVDDMLVDFDAVNALENGYSFFNLDPQFAINVDEGKYSSVRITGRFKKMSNETINDAISKKNEQINSLEKSNSILEENNQQLEEKTRLLLSLFGKTRYYYRAIVNERKNKRK